MKEIGIGDNAWPNSLVPLTKTIQPLQNKNDLTSILVTLDRYDRAFPTQKMSFIQNKAMSFSSMIYGEFFKIVFPTFFFPKPPRLIVFPKHSLLDWSLGGSFLSMLVNTLKSNNNQSLGLFLAV